MSKKEFYVSYWLNENHLDCFTGSYKECNSFIDEKIEEIAANNTNQELIDFIPQPFQSNLEEDQEELDWFEIDSQYDGFEPITEEDLEEYFDRQLDCPANKTLEEWEKTLESKKLEWENYYDCLLEEEYIF